MICIKFHQKVKKNLNFGLLGIFRFFKPKNLVFFEAIFQPWTYSNVCQMCIISRLCLCVCFYESSSFCGKTFYANGNLFLPS